MGGQKECTAGVAIDSQILKSTRHLRLGKYTDKSYANNIILILNRWTETGLQHMGIRHRRLTIRMRCAEDLKHVSVYSFGSLNDIKIICLAFSGRRLETFA